MLAPPLAAHALEREEPTPCVLPAELDFYQAYGWCLNPHLTVGEALGHVRSELDHLATVPNGWQTGEVATNVFLLSCGVLNCLDEFLRGSALRLPKRMAAMRVSRAAMWTMERLSEALSLRQRAEVRRWRDGLLSGLDDFLPMLVAGQVNRTSFVEPAHKLAAQLRPPLPPDVLAKRIGIPSPFRRLDLTHVDVLSLGRCFVERYPDRSQPILLVGLRTSGSYFAPLLKSFLAAEGYRSVSLLTIEPNKGAGRLEYEELKRFAGKGYMALLVDDPPHTAGTVSVAINIARRAGFALGKIKVLVPAHPAKRDWVKVLPENLVVLLEPEQWHKLALLEPKVVEGRLAEYFHGRNFTDVKVIASERADAFNARLQQTSSDARGARLKRIFEVQLETSKGRKETRFVLAKSVGWGWLGYHAFLAGQRLSGFVPQILGLRDGILYMEWIPQPSVTRNDPLERKTQIDTAASYVAARVGCLSLQDNSAAGMDLQRQNNGVRLLEKALSRAYGRVLTDTLVRSRLGRLLRQQPCPFPTLIDGNMQRAEWIAGPHGPIKTDYEHHGMGKAALNVTDPAYDLAEVILDLALSPEEENSLIRRYIEESGDRGVEQRLFMNKLLAGIWSMNQAQEQLFGGARDADTQQALHQRFMQAWNFLTVQTARYCGSFCAPPVNPRWRGPLVFLDIDGVIDQRLFGFPATTAAGIEALSLLSAQRISVALNTARSVAEVKDYCDAYHLAGGVAEHGSYVWDAIAKRGRALISPEAARQLEELKRHLRQTPGVFLDDRHQYSIRAFTYQDKPQGLVSSMMKSMRSSEVGDGALAPLPTLVINHLMTELKLDQLCFHHTTIDTTIMAKDVDKGTGLKAIRDWVLGADAETIAVGDHEADLTAFRAATRCFAPANISCGRQARLLGCQITGEPYQRGLLEIARAITQGSGGATERHSKEESTWPSTDDLFFSTLQAADRSWAKNLFQVLLDPAAYRIFVR
jgi:hydroxymethylpyrimidine pyrophosphatase-like HAD family hydrolase